MSIACPILSDCQSCTLSTQDYLEQLYTKKKHFVHLLKNSQHTHLHVETSAIDIITAPTDQSYRHTAKLALTSSYQSYTYEQMQSRIPLPFPCKSKEKQRLKKKKFHDSYIGLYRPNSHHVIDLSPCQIHCNLIQKTLQSLKSYLPWSNISTYQEKYNSGLLKHIVFRVNQQQNEMMITLVTTHHAPQKMRKLSDYLVAQCPTIISVMNHIHKHSSNAIFDTQGENHLIYGQDYITERILDLELRVSAGSFYQVNPAVAEQAYQYIRDIAQLEPQHNVLDLYCGVGGITLMLAKQAHQGTVIGIEETASSIIDADYNAQQNMCPHVNFWQGRVEDHLSTLEEGNTIFDCITLNPSRRGCQKQVMEKVNQFRSSKIIYMSCYAPTLLRDLALLDQRYYQVKSYTLFDMFPQTPHYEVVCEISTVS